MESVMIETAFHRRVRRDTATGQVWRILARSVRAIDRTLFAHRIRYDLTELPCRLRRDIGLIRMALAIAIVGPALLGSPGPATAQDAQVRRGQYLVTLGGCNDCHTPGYFFGKPDMNRFLGGSEVGFEIPGLGVFHGPNLTPDQETGLGTWSTEQIAAAITKGQRPDGRELAPIMPWHAFANLTAQDARAIAIYLKSLKPVKNKVPGPFGPSETPTSFVMKIVPPPGKETEGAAVK
jgi:mono/diheme cytochrome c family protein